MKSVSDNAIVGMDAMIGLKDQVSDIQRQLRAEVSGSGHRRLPREAVERFNSRAQTALELCRASAVGDVERANAAVLSTALSEYRSVLSAAAERTEIVPAEMSLIERRGRMIHDLLDRGYASRQKNLESGIEQVREETRRALSFSTMLWCIFGGVVAVLSGVTLVHDALVPKEIKNT